MSISSTDQILQLVAWVLALFEFILALYILLLNSRHIANRHVSALLFIIAVNNLALGMSLGAETAMGAALPTVLLAATTPAIQPALFVVAIALLKPRWIQARDRRWLRRGWWGLYGLILLPIVTTLLDWQLGTRLWYAGLDAESFSGGYALLADYVAGPLRTPITVINIYLMGMAPVFPLIYVALLDRNAKPSTRRLARLILIAQVVAVVVQLGVQRAVRGPVAPLITTTIFVSVYAYAAFQQMVSERRLQHGRLQSRLVGLILAVTVPLLVAVIVFISTRGGEIIEENAREQLESANHALASSVSVWLDLNVSALQQLARLPGMNSMDPEVQKPFLDAMSAAYPHMYLISTTNVRGINVARSDDAAPKDYHDRLWQIGARNGAPVTFEVVIGRTSGQPALVVSTPIRGGLGSIVGVAMFASDLDKVAQEVQASKVGETGVAFVVDAQNRVVAHPDPEVSAQLQDYNNYPPVFALRKDGPAYFSFTDEKGEEWQAYVDELENGWGVIVQQKERELLSGLAQLRRLTFILSLFGVGLLSGLAWLMIRQAFRPIETLTETATAIAAGDLTRTAPIESEDELGILARAFNSMTVQLRELITGLEQRVAERTQDLAKRTAYLEASAEVSRAAASILETDQLVSEVVEVIREQFNLYYVGLFLQEESGEWAILRAGTGAAGQAMLARGHRIKIGEGMIGWSIANAQPRVAQEAEVDKVRLVTTELPDTRSEAAIPLRSRGRVLGALTVQDSKPNAFDEAAIATLQTMADQVALTLDNARLLTESQAALETTRRAYMEDSRQAWGELLRTQSDLAFRSTERGVSRFPRPDTSQGDGADEASQRSLTLPIEIHGKVIGSLDTYKLRDSGDWTPEEMELLKEITDQLAITLDSARLYRDTQRRAAREQLTAEIANRMREALDVDTVLQTAIRTIGETLDLSAVEVRMTTDSASGKDGKDNQK